MADNASRRGATNLGMPLMILAFAAVAGFLYWLNGQANAEMAARQAYADSVAQAEAEEAARAAIVDPERIQMDASPFEGREIRLVSVPVASTFGEQGIWLEMPNGNPFLVSLSDSLRASGVALASGDFTNLTGTVRPISPTVLDEWSEAGTITDGDRLAAEFASHFIESTEIEVVPAPEDDGPAGGA